MTNPHRRESMSRYAMNKSSANRLWHFERMRHWPEGFLVVGFCIRMGDGSMQAALIYQHANSARDRSVASPLRPLIATQCANSSTPGGASWET